jgi:hypothetical protein
MAQCLIKLSTGTTLPFTRVSYLSITMAARFKTWIIFARWNTGIVGLNPTRGMDVCVRLFYVYVGSFFCVDSGLETGSSPVQGVVPTVYRLRNWKSGQGPQELYLLTYVRSWALPEKLPFVQPFRKFPAILRNPKVQHLVHKSPPLVPILSQFHPVHTIPSYLSKIKL